MKALFLNAPFAGSATKKCVQIFLGELVNARNKAGARNKKRQEVRA